LFFTEGCGGGCPLAFGGRYFLLIIVPCHFADHFGRKRIGVIAGKDVEITDITQDIVNLLLLEIV
jgi:hypothetical protein